MGMSSSLWTGANGLHTYQSAIDALSDNTANVNTIGYKKLDTTFSDLLYSTLSPNATANGEYGTTNADAIGNGVLTASQSLNFTQGPLNATGGILDFAIEGDGFFVVNGTDNREYLTRAGDFYLGSNTENPDYVDLLSGDGLSVKGFLAQDGVLDPQMTEIVMPAIGTTVPGKATTVATLAGNLDSRNGTIAGNTVTAADGWVDSRGNPVDGITVGGVQTSAALHRVSDPAAAVSASTRLTDLSVQESDTSSRQLFRNVPAGSTVNSREITVSFTRDDVAYERTFAVNNNTTLADFAQWLCGALGDSTSGGRTNGGVLGTVFTPEYADYNVSAEAAGGFLSYDGDDAFFNIACNIGAANFISDISLTATTSITSSSGKKQTMVDDFGKLFSQNKKFSNGVDESVPSTRYERVVQRSSATDMVEKPQTLSFVRVGADDQGSTWRWYAANAEGNSADAVCQGTGIVRFDTAGRYLSSATEKGAGISFDFSSLTQMGTADGISAATDGYLQGALQTYSHGDDGIIYGVYDNGYTFALAQLAMASVANTAGLYGEGGTLFSVSNVSGAAIYNTPGFKPNNFGSIRGGYLEESNYSLGADAIIIQRAYQMSSRIITVSNEMLETAVGLKS